MGEAVEGLMQLGRYAHPFKGIPRGKEPQVFSLLTGRTGSGQELKGSGECMLQPCGLATMPVHGPGSCAHAHGHACQLCLHVTAWDISSPLCAQRAARVPAASCLQSWHPAFP